MAKSFVKDRIAVVGMGLIGGSFAKALHAGGRDVYVWNRNQATLELAQVEAASGVLDDELLGSCELVVVALFPDACVQWICEHAEQFAKDAIVVDASGVKRSVCEPLFELAAAHDFIFCGAHPMAGTQFSGFAHARATLFKGAPLVLTPPPLDPVDQLELLDRIATLLEPCGFARYSVCSPEEHDRIIAYTSQLAHVVSNAYVKSPTAQKHKGFSAGSYKDLTRVAQLNAGMWTELFLSNADNLIAEIDSLTASLAQYRKALAEHNGQHLIELLEEGDRLKREADAQ